MSAPGDPFEGLDLAAIHADVRGGTPPPKAKVHSADCGMDAAKPETLCDACTATREAAARREGSLS